VPFTPSLVSRLDGDLEQLGVTPEATGADAPTVPTTTDQAWGIAYVLEGSRLGGKILARGLLADPALSTRYLYQPQDEPRWSDFRRRLREREPDPRATLAAARGAFDDIAAQMRHQNSTRSSQTR
jgi:heme oxygenase